MTRIKICGITNIDDAEAAIEYGADALGFVFYPDSPRAVSPDAAKSIISSLPPFVTTVGVFVDESKDEIERISSHAGLNIIQLHGSEPPDKCNLSRKTVKAIRVKELSDLEVLNKYTNVTAFLLDAYSPDALGGTGQVFNWEIAVEAKRFGNIILAGGLNPDNVGEAIKQVCPYAVDVASGVESNTKGKKDHLRLKAFIENAKKAFKDYV
jgi:phosphoribosylanthranilate isomerase